jgi:hypothetical protein
MSETFVEDPAGVVIEDVNEFMTQSERTVGSFVQNKHIVAGFKAMKRYSKNDVFKANCFNSAIEHVLFRGHAMTAEEQSVCVIRYLIDKNTKENWVGEVGTNVKGQDGYDTIQKTVKEMKDITMRYVNQYEKNPFLGKLPYGTVKKHAMLAIEPESGVAYEPSSHEMSVLESLSTERLGYIIAAHQAKMLFDMDRRQATETKGSAYPMWLEELNDECLAANFRVGEAGSRFVDNTYDPPRLMLTLIALKDCPHNEAKPMRFLYTGDLVTDAKYGAGYVDEFGFGIEKNVWIVPRNDFAVTNADVLHPVHFLHQEADTAHFIIVKQHRMVWIEQVRAWKKDDPLFMCYDDVYVTKRLKKKFIDAREMSSLTGLETVEDDGADNEGDSDYDDEPSTKRTKSDALGDICFHKMSLISFIKLNHIYA